MLAFKLENKKSKKTVIKQSPVFSQKRNNHMKHFFSFFIIIVLFSCYEKSKKNLQNDNSEIIDSTKNINLDTTEITTDTIKHNNSLIKPNNQNEKVISKPKTIECSCHRKHIEGTKIHRQILNYIYDGCLDSLKQLDTIHFKYIDENYNESYLFYSVKANNFEITQFLIEKGVDINVVGKYIGNALHFSIGNTKIAKLLIENGININLQDSDGVTPIMRAAKSGNIDLVQILLDNKAVLTLKDKNGLTVVDYSNGSTRAKHSKIYKPIKDLVKSFGAVSGYRLREAFKYGSVKDVEQLLKQKICKPDEKDQFGSTCLVYSCNVEKLKLLIEYGLDINIKNQDDYTGLLYASRSGCYNTVKFYLENGADINATHYGQTALDKATTEDIKELLISYGAKTTKPNTGESQ